MDAIVGQYGENLIAIGAGLSIRAVIDLLSNHSARAGPALVGIWEGAVLALAVKKHPSEPLGSLLSFAIRLFIDYYLTDDAPRLIGVIVWAALAMLVFDVVGLGADEQSRLRRTLSFYSIRASPSGNLKLARAKPSRRVVSGIQPHVRILVEPNTPDDSLDTSPVSPQTNSMTHSISQTTLSGGRASWEPSSPELESETPPVVERISHDTLTREGEAYSGRTSLGQLESPEPAHRQIAQNAFLEANNPELLNSDLKPIDVHRISAALVELRADEIHFALPTPAPSAIGSAEGHEQVPVINVVHAGDDDASDNEHVHTNSMNSPASPIPGFSAQNKSRPTLHTDNIAVAPYSLDPGSPRIPVISPFDLTPNTGHILDRHTEGSDQTHNQDDEEILDLDESLIPDIPDNVSVAESTATLAESVISVVSQDAILKHAEEYRQKAMQAENDRKRCYLEYERARRSSDRFQAVCAKVELSKAEALVLELHGKAERRYFRAFNMTPTPGIIDVHGLRRDEAIRRTEKALYAALMCGAPEFQIITGRGKHSRGRIPVLKPEIQRTIHGYGLDIEPHIANPGVLVMKLPTKF